MSYTEDMQATDLLEKLDNMGLSPVDNNLISNAIAVGNVESCALYGDTLGKENLITETFSAALPKITIDIENDEPQYSNLSPQSNITLGL